MKDDLRKHTFIIIRKDGEYVASRMMQLHPDDDLRT